MSFKEAERVAIADAVLISGLSKRTLQSLAAHGRIPGAGKPAGRWTFDVMELREWSRTVNGVMINPRMGKQPSPRRTKFKPRATTQQAYEHLLKCSAKRPKRR
jgi:hypothetical protein